MSTGTSIETARGGARRAWIAIACGVALELALAALVHQHEARAGEPLALRWLRGASEHPLRCALALALALWAFLPTRPGPPPPRAFRLVAGRGARAPSTEVLAGQAARASPCPGGPECAMIPTRCS